MEEGDDLRDCELFDSTLSENIGMCFPACGALPYQTSIALIPEERHPGSMNVAAIPEGNLISEQLPSRPLTSPGRLVDLPFIFSIDPAHGL